MLTQLVLTLLTEIEEGFFNVIAFVSILSVIIWILYHWVKSIKRYLNKLLGKKPTLSQLDRLLIDKNFVSDLRDIIEEEGGIYLFMDKMRPLIHHEDWDHDTFWSVRSFTFKNVAGIHARPIIERLINTSGFNDFLKKEKIKNTEIEAFSNGLWMVLSQRSFRHIYLRILSDVGIDTKYASRDMTDEEKRTYFNID